MHRLATLRSRSIFFIFARTYLNNICLCSSTKMTTTLSSAGDLKASSSSYPAHQNQRRGRGSGGGQDVLGMWVFYGAVFFTALLPSLVAGQTMTCVDGGGIYKYVESSVETLAKFNGLAKGVATFTELVRLHLPPPTTLLFIFFS